MSTVDKRVAIPIIRNGMRSTRSVDALAPLDQSHLVSKPDTLPIRESIDDLSNRHYFDQEEVQTLTRWLVAQLEGTDELQETSVTPDNLFVCLRNGRLLARLVLRLQTVETEHTATLRKLLQQKQKKRDSSSVSNVPIQWHELMQCVFDTLIQIGVDVGATLHARDIVAAVPHLCLALLWHLIKFDLLQFVPTGASKVKRLSQDRKTRSTNDLLQDSNPKETIAAKEQHLLKWLGELVASDGQEDPQLTKFEQLCDGLVYVRALQHLAKLQNKTLPPLPEDNSKSLSEQSNLSRAYWIMTQARQLSCGRFIGSIRSITQARPKAPHVAFVADLYYAIMNLEEEKQEDPLSSRKSSLTSIRQSNTELARRMSSQISVRSNNTDLQKSSALSSKSLLDLERDGDMNQLDESIQTVLQWHHSLRATLQKRIITVDTNLSQYLFGSRNALQSPTIEDSSVIRRLSASHKRLHQSLTMLQSKLRIAQEYETVDENLPKLQQKLALILHSNKDLAVRLLSIELSDVDNVIEQEMQNTFKAQQTLIHQTSLMITALPDVNNNVASQQTIQVITAWHQSAGASWTLPNLPWTLEMVTECIEKLSLMPISNKLPTPLLSTFSLAETLPTSSQLLETENKDPLEAMEERADAAERENIILSFELSLERARVSMMESKYQKLLDVMQKMDTAEEEESKVDVMLQTEQEIKRNQEVETQTVSMTMNSFAAQTELAEKPQTVSSTQTDSVVQNSALTQTVLIETIQTASSTQTEIVLQNSALTQTFVLELETIQNVSSTQTDGVLQNSESTQTVAVEKNETIHTVSSTQTESVVQNSALTQTVLIETIQTVSSTQTVSISQESELTQTAAIETYETLTQTQIIETSESLCQTDPLKETYNNSNSSFTQTNFLETIEAVSQTENMLSNESSFTQTVSVETNNALSQTPLLATNSYTTQTESVVETKDISSQTVDETLTNPKQFQDASIQTTELSYSQTLARVTRALSSEQRQVQSHVRKWQENGTFKLQNVDEQAALLAKRLKDKI